MEEYLLHHCVTSRMAKSVDNVSSLPIPGRSEFVLVQENHQAHGSSRVILSAMLKLVIQSFKTTNVLLLTLDSPIVAQSVGTSAKLTHIDYSADAANFELSEMQLLPRILRDIQSVEEKVEVKGVMSPRPMVVVLDSLNALVQQTSLQQVLLFLRQLREHAVVGSVITRLNASAESIKATRALTAQATALVLVETRSSLRSYSLLSQDRRREVPKEMHGLVLLVWQKKNGRSNESIEYFQVLSDQVHFVATTFNGSVPADAALKIRDGTKKPLMKPSKQHSQVDASTADSTADLDYRKSALLPVRQEEMSFNLSISAAEQQAKKQVKLPYEHQGAGQMNSDCSIDGIGSKCEKITGDNNTLFFIDEDDPDWDDDDLDDDLDI